jgi:adenine-specific DNA methylase
MSKNHKNRDNTVSVKETEVLEEVINHEVHVNNNIIEEKLSLTEEAKAEPEIKKEIKITEEVPIITEEELVPVIDDITISEEDSNEGDVFYIQINKEPFTDERLSVVM